MHRPIALCLVLAACSQPARLPRAATPGKASLIVATYNVNFGLAGDPQTLAAILSTGADVVFLQESTAAWELGIRSVMTEDFPHMAFHHSRGAGGLAILSKYPFVADETIAAPSGWFPGWRVVVESPLGPVQVLQVHLHPPVSETGSWVSGYFTTDEVRHGELAHFTRALDNDLPTIILGDFNEEDGDAIGMLKQRGLRDAVSEFNPGAPTWRWPTPVGDLTFALDHIFYSRDLEPLRCDILEIGRSDHLPIRAVFEAG